ncbi:FAD-dependent oxidoreductase [Delftia sp. DT-2]|uniref:FAD-dependent oxidoreductase n=1 Tax=Delftia sp. DT-2 TaxID=3022772 RepID=UPI00233EADA5|nr:FAD-dependent oxidoreductase [Delftia sp. DT-2]MDC2862987.1 FAD-dependent oxidoreductase [Delftia sp. DT-2]
MCAQTNINNFEVIVIGGGQAGMACGWHLQRQGRDFVILDAQDRPGGVSSFSVQ